MLTKKDFKELATMIGELDENIEVSDLRFAIKMKISDFCKRQNPRFDSSRFEEWINRVRLGQDLKGLR